MKVPTLIPCLVLGAAFAASAQTAPGPPPQPAPKSEASPTKTPPDPARKATVLRELSLQPGSLRDVVEQLQAACSKIARESDFGGHPMPALIYGPGAGDAKVATPLHLTDMRILNAIALVAAAAGCNLDPIFS